ncbi:hypothetical protein NDU88_005569 [Pleurodeles waltl]|uniref:Uncharacterized protein n=1 Tax=Pleurodeles waltl TaxID=8319 RepID=A0AAV7RNN3_PLEWA|nr:hypothetical protein NDU88_005569 [Pleurodeles waltl]
MPGARARARALIRSVLLNASGRSFTASDSSFIERASDQLFPQLTPAGCSPRLCLPTDTPSAARFSSSRHFFRFLLVWSTR